MSEGDIMSSKRRIRRKSCEGKKRYDNEAEARKQCNWFWYERDARLNVYKCKFCGGFHIGHPDRKTKRAIAAKRRRK